jgi:hypothetical protein
MSSSKRGETSDADKNDQLELESPSFTTEPFHRFGNAAAAAHRQAAAFPRVPNGGGRGGSSEARLTGGVDGKSDPEVAAYVTKERGGYAGAQFGVIHASGASVRSAVANCEPGDYVYYKHDKDRTKWEEAALYIREGEDNDKFYSHPTGKWSKIAYKILHHPAFHVFDLALSVLLMALALIEKPAVFGTDSDEKPAITIHGIFEILILCLLGVDIVLRLIWLTPKHFIRHRRTMFITVILFVMFIEVLAVLIRQESHLRITRSLRPAFFIDTYVMHGVRR